MKFKRTIYLLLPILLLFSSVVLLLSRVMEVSAEAVGVSPTPDSPSKKDLSEDLSKASTNISTGVPLAPLASNTQDKFGYSVNDIQPYDWIDITTIGHKLALTGIDNVSGEIPIGFTFPFYENSYTGLYVSTNGLISFGTPTNEWINREMPFIGDPHNIVAPFWDDLHVTTSTNGKVYYHGNLNRFVVAWHNVARFPNTSDLLTFETVLYPNGNICYQYQDLNGVLDESTVGIEDSSGTDGLTYLHNYSPGLDLIEGLKQVCFYRPAPSYRVKMLPVHQGGLAIGGSREFQIELSNTGDLGTDSYELQVVSSNPTWSVEIYNDGGLALPDNDHDGLFETKSLETGQSRPLIVKISAPDNAEIGSNTLVDITAFSQKSQNTIDFSAKIHVAYPSPFVQGVVIDDAMSLLMVWANSIKLPLVYPDYKGSTMGVTYLPGDRYLYYWEQNHDNQGVDYTDLEFSLLNGFGYTTIGPGKLTSNKNKSTNTNIVTDRSPFAAVTNDGKVGLTWIHNIENETGEEKTNVYFAIFNLNNMSGPSVGPINVTQNTGWSGSNDIPTYYSPRISTTTDNRFVLTWSDNRDQPGGNEENIGFAAYSLLGNKIAYQEKIIGLTSTPGNTIFHSPDIIGITGNRIFLSFVREDISTGKFSIGYQAMDSNGNLVENPTYIPGKEGKSPEALQFSIPKNRIFLAWLNPEGSPGNQQVTFVTINQSTFNASPTTELVTPNGLSANLLSISQDTLGNAVLSWIDWDIKERIYYALVRQDGSVIIAPVQIFDGKGKTITVSKVGASNAAYIGKNYIYLPVSMR